MSRTSTIALGLLALTVLAVLCVGTGAPRIQANVLACTQSGLADAGFAGVVTGIDGRDVTLSGPGAAPEIEERAWEIARGCGARTLGGDWGGAAEGPYATSLCLAPGRVTLAGSVPDAGVRAALGPSLQVRAGVPTLEGEVAVRSGAPDGYTGMLERAALELPQLDEGCIELDQGAVRVTGAIRSRAAMDGLRERITAAAGDAFRVSFDVEVPDLSESAVACQAAYNEMLGAGARVLFDFDSSEIHEEGRALLDTVEGIWAEMCPDVSIVVTGHTDNVGDPGYNRTLSLERARAVVAYLVDQGFDPDKLEAVGYGESQPRASNETDEGRTQNRRIEFRVRETDR